MKDSGHFSGDVPLSHLKLLELLNENIDNLSVESAQNEALPFLRDPREIEIWSKELFRAACNRIIIV